MRNSAKRPAIMVFFGAALVLVLVGTGPNPPAPRAPNKVLPLGKAKHDTLPFVFNGPTDNHHFVITLSLHADYDDSRKPTLNLNYTKKDGTPGSQPWTFLKAIHHKGKKRITLVFLPGPKPGDIQTALVTFTRDGVVIKLDLSSGDVSVTVPVDDGMDPTDMVDQTVDEVESDPCA